MERAEIAIIGTGPAGISAAITAKARNKDIILLGSNNLSDKVSKAHEILNYPGFPEISGETLAQNLKTHLEHMDIAITEKKVTAVYAMDQYFGLQAGSDMVEAQTVILATGVVQDKTFPGENEFLGRGVSYCATCDAPFYKGKTVAVVGYDEESEREADYLSEVAGKVYYFPMYQGEPEVADAVEVVRQKPKEILGTLKAGTLRTEQEDWQVDGIFILRDAVSPAQMVPGLTIADRHVNVNAMMETDIPGLFACGDIVGRPYQYVKSAGQGNVAALSAVTYLSRLKQAQAKAVKQQKQDTGEIA